MSSVQDPQDEWTSVSYASVDEDEDAFVVSLEETEDEGRALFIMSDLEEPGDEEIRTGMDTYCLVNQDDVTFYGGVERVALDDLHLEIDLTAAAAEALGLPQHLALGLAVDDEVIEELRGGLDWVLTFGNPMHRPALDLGAADVPDEQDQQD